MSTEHAENWFLKKHETGEVFGPIRFEQLRTWARAAQVNPQDVVSADGEVWTKAPMLPDLAMDWLIEVSSNLLYGPTTSEALLEFTRLGEIHRETHVINCRTGEIMSLRQAPFFTDEAPPPTVEEVPQPTKTGIKINLQKRIRDLELTVVEKNRQITMAQEIISTLETRVSELETLLAEARAKLR